MSLRGLKIYPEKVLREVCEQVVDFDESLEALLEDLAESMYANKGVGFAAPQIGITKRVAVVDVAKENQESQLIELVNPQVVEKSRELRDHEEGCLSFPGEWEIVKRPAKVTVQAQDRKGHLVKFETEGLLATALQHEIDHLDGVLFIDHISRLKRSLIERRMKKRARVC